MLPIDNVRNTPGETAWFRRVRFGLFLHFGLYSCAARHEWMMTREKRTVEDYSRYMKYFDPDLCDMRQWARDAKAAGMKYAVLTTKHHEGFCLFDSKFTDYTVMHTPAKRDLVREFVDAFRGEGLRVGFYYSLLDWHHPDFTIDPNHPRRDDLDVPEQNARKNMENYRHYMRDQLTELLTDYGRIDILWLDFSYAWDNPPDKPWLRGKGAEDWGAKELIELARSLQPGILINNRSDIEQDLWTPEQYQVQNWLRHPESGERVTWEACQTFSGSWGYYRDEMSWKSPQMLLQMLIQTVSCGGNLIMNVGPTGRGDFDTRAQNALAVYGTWMKHNCRSIYGCTQADDSFHTPNGCRLTQSEDGKRLYVHLFQYPFAFLELPSFGGRVEYAQFLHDGSELQFTENAVDHFSEGQTVQDKLLVIKLPPHQPEILVPVIELFLKE